jgi:hypothetical protein
VAHWNWQDFWCNICEFSGVLMWPTEMCAILGAILNYDVVKIAKTMRVLMEIEHVKNQVVQFF